MDTQISPTIREQVIVLANTMPIDKLVSWYEYGLFIQSRYQNILSDKIIQNDDFELMDEIQQWEAASDEDALLFEHVMEKESL
ncbi:MAG: hypothetical protein HQK63_16775 [Desulfamplus sp.]|nr:hypothetical protein [Desulfamplus sp.]